MDFAKRTCPPSASGAPQMPRIRTSQLPHPGGHPANDIERLTSSIPTKDAVEAYKSSAKWSGASITIQSNKPNKPQQPPSFTPQPTSTTRCSSSTSSSSSPPSSSRSSLPAPSSSARVSRPLQPRAVDSEEDHGVLTTTATDALEIAPCSCSGKTCSCSD